MNNEDKIKEFLMVVKDQFKDNKKIAIGIVVILAVILFASLSQASGDHNCQGGHNCNDGGGTNEQTQDQTQSQSSTNTNENAAVSGSSSGASSNANSSSNSGGNSLSAVGGESRSSSESTGGSAESTTGDVTVEGDRSQYSYINEDSAASAAALFVSYCQSGVSGQTQDGGFSIASSDVLCDRLKMAGAMKEAYNEEMRDCGNPACVGICTAEVAEMHMERSECELTDQAEYFLAAYYENLRDANDLVEGTEWLDKTERVADRAFKPALLLALLIFAL